MSLSAWERQTLDSIGHGLAGSDPQLAALLSTFTELASGEEMPVREEIGANSRRPIRCPLHKRWYRCRARGCRYMRRKRRRLGLQGIVVLLWLVVTAATIGAAVALSRGTVQGTCTGSWVTFCAASPTTPRPNPAAHEKHANQVPLFTQMTTKGLSAVAKPVRRLRLGDRVQCGPQGQHRDNQSDGHRAQAQPGEVPQRRARPMLTQHPAPQQGVPCTLTAGRRHALSFDQRRCAARWWIPPRARPILWRARLPAGRWVLWPDRQEARLRGQRL